MFVRGVVSILISLGLLFYLSWLLTVALIVSLIPLLLFGVWYGKKVKALQKTIQDKVAGCTTVAEESFTHIKTVKAFSTEGFETHKYFEGLEEVYQSGVKKCTLDSFFVMVLTFVIWGVFVMVIILGSYLSINGMIDLGDITAFLLMALQLMTKFGLLAATFGAVMSTIGASAKIIKIMETVPLVNTEGGEIPRDVPEGRIVAQNLKFHYPSKPTVEVLKDMSFEIKRNKVIALVGKSGCGKSSVIAVLERYYNLSEGSLLFDGNNITMLEPHWYKKHLSLVQQEPILFSGSVRENICYGLNEDSYPSDQEIYEVCKQANAYEFLINKEKFPQGLDSIVGEKGIKLSGGQKQRIAIARALVKKPKVLLLDEATSALDAESEHQVQLALDELMQQGGKTIIVIAHRLSTVRSADEILVIDHGVIVEKGKHDELIQKKGIYHKLVKKQLQEKIE